MPPECESSLKPEHTFSLPASIIRSFPSRVLILYPICSYILPLQRYVTVIRSVVTYTSAVSSLCRPAIRNPLRKQLR